jgi:hypothetical protein
MAPTPATTIRRLSERARTDRDDLYALLDEVWWGTLCTSLGDLPWVVPVLFARVGDRILIHGSTGAGALRHAADGNPVAFSVTALDGIVVADSAFNSSANYRSAVVTGKFQSLPGDEKGPALDALTNRLIPGRTSEVVVNSAKEMAATVVLALPITDGAWTMKVRTGGPSQLDDPTDAWRGVVPVSTTYGTPEPTPDSADRPLPHSVQRLLRGDRW